MEALCMPLFSCQTAAALSSSETASYALSSASGPYSNLGVSCSLMNEGLHRQRQAVEDIDLDDPMSVFQY